MIPSLFKIIHFYYRQLNVIFLSNFPDSRHERKQFFVVVIFFSSVFFIILSVILSPESVANVIELRGVWFVSKLGCSKSFNFCASRLFLSCLDSRCQYKTSYLLFLSSWLNKLERFLLPAFSNWSNICDNAALSPRLKNTCHRQTL